MELLNKSVTSALVDAIGYIGRWILPSRSRSRDPVSPPDQQPEDSLVGDLSVPPLADHHRAYVDYVLPPYVQLCQQFDGVNYAWDGQEWTDHESLGDLARVPGEVVFCLKHFGVEMTSDQVIAWAKANGYRVASHLEALAFALAHRDPRCTGSQVALGSFVRCYGDEMRFAARVHPAPRNPPFYQGLTIYAFDERWLPDTRFYLVRVAPFETATAS